MATSTTPLDVLVVASGPAEPASVGRRLGFEDEAVSVSVATPDDPLGERLASRGADCVLWTTDPDSGGCLDRLRELRRTDETVPVLLFAGDCGAEYVTAALEAGATDVVQSTVAASPSTLVRRRVEGIVDDRQRRAVRETERRERDRERRWYEGIVETTRDTAAVYDEDGRFKIANGRLAELYDTTPAELRGEHSHLLAQLQSQGTDPFGELVEGDRETYRTELELDYPGQAGRVTDVRLSRLTDDGEFAGVVAIGRDVTERREREQKIADQRDALARLDRLNAVIRDVDQALVGATTREEIETAVCERLAAAGRYMFAMALSAEGDTLVPTAWTDGAEVVIESVLPLEEVTAETSPALRALETGTTQVVGDVGEREAVPWRDQVVGFGVESLVAVPLTYEGEPYGVVVVCAGQPDAFDDQEVTILAELGETVGRAIAAVERREREETLTALYEATRELLGTETEQEVSDVVVDVATTVLELPEVGIFLFDDEDNVLRPATATDELVAFYGGADRFGPGRDDSETWHAFVTGETKVFDDISESERVANPDTEARSTFVHPLGEHGVFVAASTETGVFDGSRRKLLGLLAATAETALDRVAGQAGIRERERELRDRDRRLDRLSRASHLFRDVAGTIVGATTREEIETATCERLAAEDGIALAWIGTAPPDGDCLHPRVWAGDGGEYLDSAPLAVDGTEPAAQTAVSGSVTVVGNVTDHLREAEWARAASDGGYQSAVAVPLSSGVTTYGVVAVYASDPDTLDGLEDVLGELGELVGYAIDGAETRQSVLADRATELELRIPGTRTFANAVAESTSQPVRYREVTPADEGRAHLLFAIADVSPEAVLALEAEFVGVESLQHVGSGNEHRFRATVTGSTVATTLLSCGGVPDEIRSHPDETVAVVSLPSQLDVRVFVERVREVYPDAELLSRRDRSGPRAGDVRETMDTKLTDRQREVLTTAYESGFFESPRETTGAQLADLLDVSQPTVTHHLREGQRRLFAVLFEDLDN